MIYRFLYIFVHIFAHFYRGYQDRRRRPPVLRGRLSDIGGCWGHVGRCVCASGAADAAPGGRAVRLLDLTANEERTTRGGAGADPESEILGIFENSEKPSIFKVLCFA